MFSELPGPAVFAFIVIGLAVFLLPGEWRLVGAVVVPVALMGGTVLYDKVKARRATTRRYNEWAKRPWR